MNTQVVVPSYKGPNADSFTYEVPKGMEIKPGQLVIVPFGKRKELGIILSTDYRLQTTAYKLKQIDGPIFEKPFLLPYQLELLKWMSHYYLATMGNCLNSILPQLPTKFSILNSQFSINKQGQTLVLVPTINNIPQTMALFPKATNPVVYHSELKPAEKLRAWIKVLNIQADYIFGTRQAIFFPSPNLRKIIILNEHDDAYKDQRSPYYDTLTVAEKISELTNAKLQIVDWAPRVTTYFLFKRSLQISSRQARTIATNLVSMIDERKSGNKTAISNELKNQIAGNLKAGGNALLYLNKKKESGTLYCNSCRYQKTLLKEPERCPNCKSPDIFFASLNVNSLAKTVRSLFPKTEVNIMADAKTTSYKRPATSNQIDIATSVVFYQLLPKHYELVAAVAIDSILNQPEFSAPEKAYTQLVSLRRLATHQFIVQTYQTDNPILQYALAGNYQAFYETQIKERKALLYPPFAQLVKLVVKGKKAEKTLAKAESLASELSRFTLGPQRGEDRRALPINDLQFTILGPFEPYFQKTTSTYNIILKTPLKFPGLSERGKMLKEIRTALIQSDIFRFASQVIVDPVSLN